MKNLLAITLAASLLAPAAAIAQPRSEQADRRGMSSADWAEHVRACKARYRSYNERTDTYVLRPGVTRQCVASTSRTSPGESVNRRGMTVAQWKAHVRYRSYNERTDT